MDVILYEGMLSATVKTHRLDARSFSFDVEMALRAAVLPHLIAYKEAQRELTSNWSSRAAAADGRHSSRRRA